MIHPQAGTSHNAQLQPDCISVQVDLVLENYSHIPLPVPTEEHRLLDDVRSSFIQWPKIGIILDKVISKIIQHEIFEKSTNTHLFLVVIQPQRKSTADDGTSTEVLPHQIADLGQVSVTTTVEPSEIQFGPSEVLPAPEPTPDRQLVTEEEYNCLPKDMQDLHDHLMSLPEDRMRSLSLSHQKCFYTMAPTSLSVGMTSRTFYGPRQATDGSMCHSSPFS